MPRMSNKKIIRRIKAIRTKNNMQWMKLLELAVQSNPKKAKEILRQIVANDLLVTQWTSRIH